MNYTYTLPKEAATYNDVHVKTDPVLSVDRHCQLINDVGAEVEKFRIAHESKIKRIDCGYESGRFKIRFFTQDIAYDEKFHNAVIDLDLYISSEYGVYCDTYYNM